MQGDSFKDSLCVRGGKKQPQTSCRREIKTLGKGS